MSEISEAAREAAQKMFRRFNSVDINERDWCAACVQSAIDAATADLRGRLETAEVAREGDISRLRAKIHAACGLLAPLGRQATPSVLAIRQAMDILR